MASAIMGTPPPLSSTRSSPPNSSSRSSPSSGSFNSDDSELELSFDYIYDEAGKVVRVSKGSSRQHSGPPTPPKTTELPTIQASASNEPARRSSLSRSESLPGGSSIVPPVDTLSIPANQLSRTTSGPVSMVTPAPASRALGVAPLSGGLHGTGRRIGGAQRIRREEAERQRREIEERIRREEEEAEQEHERERLRRAAEEKENQRQSPPGSRPIVSLPNRQTFQSGLSRTTRSTTVGRIPPSISKINEHEASENEFEEVGSLGPQGHQPHQRRAAMDTNGDSHSYLPASRSLTSHQSSNHPRPASTYGSAYGFSVRARRVTAEERLRQEQELAEEQALAEAAELQERRSPSPLRASINGYYSQSRTRQALHQRQETETLRSGMPISQHTRQEDIGMDQHPRLSPSSRSLGGTTVVQDRVRAERSPPAPARPKSVAGEYAEVNENGRSQRAQRHQSIPVLDPKKNFIVNRKAYARLDMIGKGGSSRVYRVMDNQSNEIYAVKRVSFDKSDDETVSGYMNEISLLKRLEGNRRVIKLLDNELKGAGNGSKGTLFLIMECGEIDLARLLQEQQKEPMNMIWIAYYWQQILEAVQVIHDEKIVHSDLKPANFVLVKGQLKLIDFGIAKAIANDTTNIQRDHQIGTVNYMSPEAIEIPDGMRRLKVGRPSDVWSLGCILYQMVYGHPPFHALTVLQKMKAIPDRNHVIDFPDTAVPSLPVQRSSSNGGAPLPPKLLTHLARPVRRDVIRTMQVCLVRDAKQRATIPELLEDEWLAMKEPTPPPPPPPPPTPPPPPPPELKEDEAIITPIYMMQLLSYGMSCDKGDWPEEELERKAKELVAELNRVNPYRA